MDKDTPKVEDEGIYLTSQEAFDLAKDMFQTSKMMLEIGGNQGDLLEKERQDRNRNKYLNIAGASFLALVVGVTSFTAGKVSGLLDQRSELESIKQQTNDLQYKVLDEFEDLEKDYNDFQNDYNALKEQYGVSEEIMDIQEGVIDIQADVIEKTRPEIKKSEDSSDVSLDLE